MTVQSNAKYKKIQAQNIQESLDIIKTPNLQKKKYRGMRKIHKKIFNKIIQEIFSNLKKEKCITKYKKHTET